ncbi:hypothetical protein R1flu_025829 [Riccia fluitans]|uniref:Ribosomal protein L32 n=1 Tax=Riccia fluitans TaxID=41844 RepID=A0ABD1XYV0_9MARC
MLMPFAASRSTFSLTPRRYTSPLRVFASLAVRPFRPKRKLLNSESFKGYRDYRISSHAKGIVLEKMYWS